MSPVRNIRQLRGRLQAEVVLGPDGVGQNMSVQVELDIAHRNNPELRAALDELHAVIERQALDKVREAAKWRIPDLRSTTSAASA